MHGRPYIAEVIVSAAVAAKINSKHSVTVAEVREAFVLREDVRAGWVSREDGPRLFVIGTTYEARTLKASLCPVDEREGVWRLATAMGE